MSLESFRSLKGLRHQSSQLLPAWTRDFGRQQGEKEGGYHKISVGSVHDCERWS